MNGENCTAPAMAPRKIGAIHPLAVKAGSASPPCPTAITGSSAATAKAILKAVTNSGPWRIRAARPKAGRPRADLGDGLKRRMAEISRPRGGPR